MRAGGNDQGPPRLSGFGRRRPRKRNFILEGHQGRVHKHNKEAPRGGEGHGWRGGRAGLTLDYILSLLSFATEVGRKAIFFFIYFSFSFVWRPMGSRRRGAG